MLDDAAQAVLGPDVAHRAEAQAGNAQHRFHEHLALGAGAEQRDVDLLQVRVSGGGGGGRLLPATAVLVAAGSRQPKSPSAGTVDSPSAGRAERARRCAGRGGRLARSLSSSSAISRLPGKWSRSAVPGDAPSGRTHASRPGLRSHNAAISSTLSTMKAVVNASATAAGASLGPRSAVAAAIRARWPRERDLHREPPAHRHPRARIQDVVPLRTPDALSACDASRAARDPRRLTGIAQRQRPSVAPAGASRRGRS